MIRTRFVVAFIAAYDGEKVMDRCNTVRSDFTPLGVGRKKKMVEIVAIAIVVVAAIAAFCWAWEDGSVWRAAAFVAVVGAVFLVLAGVGVLSAFFLLVAGAAIGFTLAVTTSPQPL